MPLDTLGLLLDLPQKFGILKGARGPSYVILPASWPHLVSGLKQGWVFAWRSLIAGEMIFGYTWAQPTGHDARDLNDINQVVAVMLPIVAIDS